MQTEKELKSLSKFMSLVLRHEPELIGMTLDRAGWVAIDELVACALTAGKSLSHANVREIVARSDKQRFAISGTACESAPIRVIRSRSSLACKRPSRLLCCSTERRAASCPRS